MKKNLENVEYGLTGRTVTIFGLNGPRVYFSGLATNQTES